MRYGHFDDKRREYVITRPDTPVPWINYLGTDEFFGIISNTAGSLSFPSIVIRSCMRSALTPKPN